MRLAAQLPNALTIARLALTPMLAGAILRSNFAGALGYCFAAGISDTLDGFLARRFGWGSRLGAYLDPVADKIMLGTVYVCLGWVGAVPWWVVAMIFGRDVVILSGVALLYFQRHVTEFPPSVLGKLSTTFQILAAFFILVTYAYWPEAQGWLTLPIWWAVLWTVLSGLDYTRRGWSLWRRRTPFDGSQPAG